MNTLCPKLGAAQWSCSAAECTCHLKASASLREMNEEIRRVALGLEPLGIDDHRDPGEIEMDDWYAARNPRA
jgi:hypothetical protein